MNTSESMARVVVDAMSVSLWMPGHDAPRVQVATPGPTAVTPLADIEGLTSLVAGYRDIARPLMVRLDIVHPFAEMAPLEKAALMRLASLFDDARLCSPYGGWLSIADMAIPKIRLLPSGWAPYRRRGLTSSVPAQLTLRDGVLHLNAGEATARIQLTRHTRLAIGDFVEVANGLVRARREAALPWGAFVSLDERSRAALTPLELLALTQACQHAHLQPKWHATTTPAGVRIGLAGALGLGAAASFVGMALTDNMTSSLVYGGALAFLSAVLFDTVTGMTLNARRANMQWLAEVR